MGGEERWKIELSGRQNALKVEITQDSSAYGWLKAKVSFDTAYGTEVTLARGVLDVKSRAQLKAALTKHLERQNVDLYQSVIKSCGGK